MENLSQKQSDALIWLLAVFCFVLGSSQQYILGLPDQIAADTGVSLSTISLLMSSYALANALFAPVILVVAGRLSQRRQMIIGMVLIVVGLAIMGVSDSFAVLIFARVLAGVGNGVYVATAYLMASSLAKPGKQATAMADVGLGFSASLVLAMPIARALRDVVSWHWAYSILAVLGVIGIIAVSKFIPEDKRSASSASIKERMTPLANKAIVAALLGTLFIFMTFSTFYTYVTPFLDFVLPELGSTASLVLFGLGVMSLIGTKTCGLISDALGPRRALEFCLVVQIVMLGGVFALEHAGYAIIPAMYVWMAAAWMFVPVQNVVLSRLAGEGSAMAISLSNSFQQFGNAFGAPVAGAILAVASVTILPLAALSFAVLAFVSESIAFKLGGVDRSRSHRAE